MSAKTHAWWLTYGNRVVTGLGVAGMIGSAALSAWGMYKSVRKVQEKTAELQRPLTPKEKFKYCWYYFLPSGTLAIASGGCIIGASQNSAKVNTALAADFAASQASLALLKEKTAEVVGKAKAEAIQQKVIEEKMLEAPLPSQPPVPQPGAVVFTGDTTWFWDVPSQQYYRSNINKVRTAFLNLRDRLSTELAIPWNELFYEINAPELNPLPVVGNQKGFVVHGSNTRIEHREYPAMLPDGSSACIAIDYDDALEYIDWKKVMHGDGS